MTQKSTKARSKSAVVVQKPNTPLIVAVVSAAVHILLGSGFLADVAFVVFIISLTVWGVLEILQGANGFRKMLGWLGLIVAAASLYKILVD